MLTKQAVKRFRLQLGIMVRAVFRGNWSKTPLGTMEVTGRLIRQTRAGVRMIGIMLMGEGTFRPLSDFASIQPIAGEA